MKTDSEIRAEQAMKIWASMECPSMTLRLGHFLDVAEKLRVYSQGNEKYLLQYAQQNYGLKGAETRKMAEIARLIKTPEATDAFVRLVRAELPRAARAEFIRQHPDVQLRG